MICKPVRQVLLRQPREREARREKHERGSQGVVRQARERQAEKRGKERESQRELSREVEPL